MKERLLPLLGWIAVLNSVAQILFCILFACPRSSIVVVVNAFQPSSIAATTASATATLRTTTIQRRRSVSPKLFQIVNSNNNDDDNGMCLTRKEILERTAVGLFGGVLLTTTTMSSSIAMAANDVGTDFVVPKSIPPCNKASSSNDGSPTATSTCISTASVRQIDLYSTPWTWSAEKHTVEEVVRRLKGAIVSCGDGQFEVTKSVGNEYIVAKGMRNFATDEMEFLINNKDHIITYRCQQIDDGFDFNGNKKQRARLEEIRKLTGLLFPMGYDVVGDTADTAFQPQGINEQLKAFWGFQSGGGYEDILLE